MRALIAIAFVALLGGGDAVAATCAGLRAQLASAQSGGGSPKLRAQYDAYGCSSSSAWGRHRACAGIERQMRGGGASSRTVRALQSQVAAACAAETRDAFVRDDAPAARAPAARSGGTRMIGGRVVAAAPADADFGDRGGGGGGGGFFGNIFGGRARVVRNDEIVAARAAARAGAVERLDMEEARGRRRERNADDDPGGSAGEGVDIAAVANGSGGKKLREGSTQTVCVRLCDGFYFPINDRSHSANFYEELAMCVGRCPGADVSLYEHASGTPVESMRSTLSNERYTDLPTAFEYRKGLTGGCGCQTRSVIAEGGLDAERTLGYVGLARGASPTPSAPEAAVAAHSDGVQRSWSPLRAVFDETGEPLPPSLTARTVVDGRLRAMSAGRTPVVAAAPAAGPPQQLPITGPEPLRLREVGPQFFSKTLDGEPGAAVRRRMAPQVVTTTAVRVVPLAPGATVGAAPSELPAADAPAAPPLDEAAALATSPDVDFSALAANRGG